MDAQYVYVTRVRVQVTTMTTMASAKLTESDICQAKEAARKKNPN